MKQYRPSSEVDFVVIGSGAGGGIMAKQLSLAGFSVVVLEQGGWGKYGREHEYNKDEWLNLNLSDDDRLMSDPSRQRNTFRRNDKEKAVPGTHSYGCVVGGGTHVRQMPLVGGAGCDVPRQIENERLLES